MSIADVPSGSGVESLEGKRREAFRVVGDVKLGLPLSRCGGRVGAMPAKRCAALRAVCLLLVRALALRAWRFKGRLAVRSGCTLWLEATAFYSFFQKQGSASPLTSQHGR